MAKTISAATKGQYYKRRTVKWLQGRGYVVAKLEILRAIHGKPGLFVKQDQLGSDLLAVNRDETLFVQVKLANDRLSHNIAAAKREFEQFPVPPGSSQLIVIWRMREREPHLWRRRSDDLTWIEPTALLWERRR